MKRQDPAVESLVTQDTTQAPTLEDVIQRVAEDSREQPEQYLRETVVPDGGE